MKRRRMDIVRGAVGLILCLAAASGIYYWELYGRNQMMTAEIVVLNQAVEAGDYIRESNVSIVRRPVEMLIDQPIDAPAAIVGMVAKHRIAANLQMDSRSFERTHLVPGEDEYVFKMPRDWVESLPSSLRRSDEIILYPVRTSHRTVASSQPAERGSEPLNDKYFRVAFVKNSANQEVTSTPEGTRLYGTSTVASIEIIVDLEAVDRMSALYSEGYRFIVMYR